MSFANVNIGTTAGDGTGDPLRVAFNTINQNFANIASGEITVNAPIMNINGYTSNVYLTVNDIPGALSLGNLYTQLSNFTGNLAVSELQTSGNTTNGFNGLYVGLQSGFVTLPSLVAQFTANYNSYSQINSQNTATGNQSTTDYVATANNGSNTTNYIDMGIAGSAYDGTVPNNSLGTSLYPNDGYLYAQGSTPGVVGGNLVLGTTVPGTGIRFLAGGVNSSNIAVAINNPGTNPTNNATGALVVTGGVGISGNINVGQYNSSLHNIRGNLLLGLGNVIASTDSILTINQNSATPLIAPNNVVHISAVDGKIAQYGADSFGPGAGSGVYLRRARGTSATPTAIQSGDVIGFIAGRGFGATTLASPTTTAPSTISLVASENYTDTAQGTHWTIQTIPLGSNTASNTAVLNNNLVDFYPNVNIRGNLSITGNINFTMANVSQWTTPVYTLEDALNQLAQRLANFGH